MKRRMWTVLSVTAAMTAIAAPASAFDTGAHFEATARGLKRAGFSDAAIDHARVANFQVDYMVNQKSVQRTGGQKEYRAHSVAPYFHFDDLKTHDDVNRDFAWLEQSARTYVTGNKNPESILNALGIVLHAVQDFYSHSTVADRELMEVTARRLVMFEDLADDFARSHRSTMVWANIPFTPSWPAIDRAGIYTGNSEADLYGFGTAVGWPGHGNGGKVCEKAESAVECGLNHDGVPRRGHLTAMLSAAEATRQWARKFEGWVADAAVWASVKNYSSSAVPGCIERARQTSEAAGAWGYPQSLDKTDFLDWAATGAGCNWDFQDRWSDTLLAMFLATVPVNVQLTVGTDPITAAPIKAPWPNLPTFQMPVRPAVPTADMIGTYNVTWGDRVGTLNLTAVGDSIGGSLTIEGVTRTLTPLKSDGPKITIVAGDLEAAKLKGDVHFFTATKNGVAGFLRDINGVANGFYATKL